MPQWTQPGFAVVGDGPDGMPIVVSFRPGRFMAERDMEANRLPEGMEGAAPKLQAMCASLRIVPATLVFDDGAYPIPITRSTGAILQPTPG